MEENNNLSENEIDTNNTTTQVKTKAFEKNRKYIYVEQRNEILNRIYDVLQITETNKVFFSDFVEREEIANAILELEEDIKRYFNVSTWSSFKKNVVIKNNRALSIVKSVLKDMNVLFEKYNTKKKSYPNNDIIYVTQYRII